MNSLYSSRLKLGFTTFMSDNLFIRKLSRYSCNVSLYRFWFSASPVRISSANLPVPSHFSFRLSRIFANGVFFACAKCFAFLSNNNFSICDFALIILALLGSLTYSPLSSVAIHKLLSCPLGVPFNFSFIIENISRISSCVNIS